MSLYSTQGARRSLFNTVIYRALSQISTVLSYVVLVRSTVEETFGVINLLYAIIPLISTIGSLGLDPVLRRFQPEFLQGGNLTKAAWLLRRVSSYRFLTNLAMIALILLLWPWVAPFFDLGPYRSQFAVFGVLILLHFQVLLLQYSMSSYMLHHFAVGSVAVLSVGKLVGYSLVAWFATLDLNAAIVVDLIAYSAAYLLLLRGFLLTQREARQAPPMPLHDAQDARRMRRYAAYSYLNEAGSVLQYNETDRFFIAALMNSIAVASYAFYTRLMDMATSLIPQRLFDNLVQPLFFAIPPAEAAEKLPRYFSFLINFSLLYQLPLLTFAAVYHHDLVLVVFAGKYIEYSYLLPLTIFFATADWVFSSPIHLIAQYRERTGLIFRSQMLGVYLILAMLTLVPVLGLLGAVIASGTYHIVRNAFMWFKMRNDAIWKNWRASLVASALLWGTTAALCLALTHFTQWSPLVNLVVGALVCGTVALLFMRTSVISEADRRILANVFHGRETRALHLLGLAPRS
ncbi:MAG: hypothetical protein ABIT36_12835 [Steroidobacteraceae bacterium]